MEKSSEMYLQMLEKPALCFVGVNANFTWGPNLTESQFQSKIFPIFQLELLMNEKGAYYSTEPTLFYVSYFSYAKIIKVCHNNYLSLW